jgi:alpha-tubulin suppressor-like RCC1 family protein
MWSWGASSISGKSPSINNSSPVQIGSDTDWNKTTAGLTHAGAIKTSGILWVWGDNAEGKLGNNATAFEAEPIQIGSLKWGEISFGNNNSIGITAETT